MQPAFAPAAVGAVLLVVGGAPKIARPEDTVGALRSVGWRVPPWLVRAGGAGEALLGVAALGTGSQVALALVAASYAGFTAFVVRALRTGGAVASCGCVGRPDTPPTVAHAGLTGLLTAGCAVATATGTGLGLPARPVAAAALLALTAVAGWLAWLVLTGVAQLQAARSSPVSATGRRR